MSECEINKLSDIFKLLGSSARLRIILAIKDRELCVAEIVKMTGISYSAVSQQLKELKFNNLVKCRKVKNFIYYKISDLHVLTILESGIVHVKEC